MNGSSDKKRVLKLIVVFFLTTVLTLCAIMAVMYIRQRFDGDGSDFGPAQDSEVVEKDGDKTASMRYSGYITVDTSEKKIALYFENSLKSRKTISFDIVCDMGGESIMLGRVSKLMPGDKIESVKLEGTDVLEQGQYKGKFLLNFYNEQGAEEIVNSNIDIDVVIK